VNRRTLGESDLTITPIGLGAWAIGGGDWIFGWGPQKDADSLATIRRAVDRGINWIDTAAVYGLGRAESIIARALRDIPRRERPYIFTTCGLIWDELGNVSHSLNPQSIRREVEASLRRLEVDCIDLYQIGWPAGPNVPCGHDCGSLEEAWETMAALQREGKARFIGVSNCDAEQLASLRRIAPVTSLQTPYSLLRRDIEAHTLPFCEHHRISVIAASPMQSGLLSGKMTSERIASLPHNDWRRYSPDFQGIELRRALELVERLAAIGVRDARTPGAVAVAWTLHNAAVTATSVGARQPHQLDDVIGATSLQLDAEEIDELEHASSPAHVRVRSRK
jgi:aryl-alcohol dehydrogenase-like predicted oxidoreductase